MRPRSRSPAPLPRRRLAVAALAWAGGAWLGPALAAAAAKGERVRWPEVQLLDGQAVPEPALRHQAAVVVFFATTCPFCVRHNVHVQKLVQASAGLPLQVLGVSMDRSADPVRRYLARHGYSFNVTMDERALHDALSPRRVMPLTCVLDRTGRLQEVIPGEMTEDDVLGLARWARA